jgi:hypothetical protein
MSYFNHDLCALYNRYPTLDKIDIVKPPEDTSKYYKVVDHSAFGIVPGSMADSFSINLNDPLKYNHHNFGYEKEVV